MSCTVSLLVAGIVSLLAFSAQLYFENQFKETISRQQFTMVSALAEQVDDKIYATHAQLDAIAKALTPEILGNPTRAQRFLESRLGTRRVFDGGIYLLDPSGRMYAGAGMEPHMQGKDYSFRDYFRKTITTGKPCISAPLVTTQKSGHPTIVFASPVFDARGRIAGVLIGALDLLQDNFLGKLAALRIAQTGYLYLYDTSRTVIMHPDRSRILKRDVPPGANKLFDRAIEGFEGTGATVTSRGLHALSSFKHLKAANWILAANYPEAEAYAPIHRAKRYFLLALTAAVVVTILIVWSSMRRLTSPLRTLTGHVREITAEGQLHHPITVSTRDEIGTLAEAFNRMLAGLESKNTALQEEKEKIAQALSLLGATLESTADGILVTNSRGGIVRVNRRFAEIWRIAGPVPSADDETLRAVVGQQLAASADFQALVSKLAGCPEAASHDILELAEGRTFEVFSQPQIIAETIVGRVWSFRDISERKRLEAQLRHAQKMEAIGTLAGGIAHDFNTILTAVMGYGNILRTETDRNSAQATDCLDEILAAADRGVALTQSLLTYSRKEAANPILLDLNGIVRHMGRFLTRLLGEGIELCIAVAERDLAILADRGQIEQVLMNLATNARDAMPSGGKLVISTGRSELDSDFAARLGLVAGGVYALLTVADTGAGMDEETVQRIFEPFFTTKETGKGTGLGLAIVYGIVRQHKGVITVTSRPGTGTTFSIYFPLHASGGSAAETR
jgi:signal transduction histidine kinase/HAMP domain-containing protein